MNKDKLLNYAIIGGAIGMLLGIIVGSVKVFAIAAIITGSGMLIEKYSSK